MKMTVRNVDALSRRALLVGGLALLALLPSSLSAQNAPVCPGADFTEVGAISSKDGKLQAVIKVVNGKRNIPTSSGSTSSMLRYFEGYNPADQKQKWPLDASAAGPGPTLRAEIGDVVNITLLNQVKVQDFAGSLDSGEEGRNNGCDQTTKVTSQGTDKNFYPADDKYPNCFHGSSSANIHFHGTHVTPSTTGDNVLVNVRPNPKVTEAYVREPFNQIFQHCALGQQPQKWGDLPKEWREAQEKLLQEYDVTAPYVGPGRNPDGHGLPPELQLWPQNRQAIDQGVWPQWYSGSYPYCFQIPKCTLDGKCTADVRMGQSPGTHWYHSHKHGSTSINLFNGLAGAFIIADNSPTGYDGKLKSFYKDNYQAELKEQVIVFQQITPTLNLESATGGPSPPVLVNGALAPAITMRPGEVQLWRMVNATVAKTVNGTFSPAGINFRQTAQDGVQLAWENYSNAANGTQPINLAPANRVDLLVQAPATEGCYTLQSSAATPVVYLNIKVSGDAANPAMGFPAAEGDYPPLPPFLKKIDPATIHLRRDVTFSVSKAAVQPPLTRTLPQFKIDGKQFEDQIINQVMLLDSAEEWTIYNTDAATPKGSTTKLPGAGVAHPFHIHINPFQIVEVFDPNKDAEKPQVFSSPFVWWDTFAIPAGKAVTDNKCYVPLVEIDGFTVCPGYFKMRSRFVDFTGQYVQHCHILAHEDRGMMQLLEVVSNKAVLKHH
jgi:FtsP/CotA-like multicopper oxidase with cupredoxin domain